MRHRFALRLSLSLALAAGAFGQAAGQPAFEVATVKAADDLMMTSGPIRIGMSVDAGRVDIHFMSLTELLRTAYRLKPYQVTGPSWMSSQRYDIQAKIPDGATKDQVPEMLQSLLAERFKVALHRETKEHAIYALIVGKNGPNLKEAAPDPPVAEGSGDGPKPTMMTFGPAGGGARIVGGGPGGPGGGASSGRMVFAGGGDGKAAVFTSSDGANAKMSTGGVHLERKMTTSAFADFLSRFVDRPVVDMTELKGTYEIAMDVPLAELLKGSGANIAVRTSVNGMPADPGATKAALDQLAESSSGGTIFSAVQKLGLKLDPRKAPMEILVVDRAERSPTEN